MIAAASQPTTSTNAFKTNLPSPSKTKGGEIAPTAPYFHCATEQLARGAALFFADTGLFAVRQTATDVHERTALGALRATTAMGVGREARARRNQPADDHVFLQAAQVVLQATHGRFR